MFNKIDENTLENKYKELRAREVYIKEELRRDKKMPRPKVSRWLHEVEKLRKQVQNIEKSHEYKVSNFLSNHHLGFNTKMLSIKMDQLRMDSNFSDGLTVPITVIVDQCPERPQLLGTIWENLMDPNVGVTSIYGSAGVGKTTAMKKIRNQLSASDTFDLICWVSVSNAYMGDVQENIALQMKLNLSRVQEERRTTLLCESLQQVGKFLIIFDDLRKPISLTEMGIPRLGRANGCKIVFISRDFDVCRSMQSDKFNRVDALSWAEKWNLFVEKAGNIVLDPEIKPLARQIVEICPGLPFIVTTIGHAMRDETREEEWRKALVYGSTRTSIFGECISFKLLKICYNRLECEILQSCFLYCALFPGGHLFKSEELMRYWIGETFIQKEGDIVSQMDEGRAIIRKLVDSNLLEMITEGGGDRLMIPLFGRDMAINIMNEKPRFLLDGGHRCQRFGCHLVEYREISPVETPYFMWPQSHSVSTLLLCHSRKTSFPHHIFFHDMSALRLLDLSHTYITDFPTRISRLVKLRVLLLQNCWRIQTIPNLEEMEELEILSLQGTSITELPQGMERMTKLRSLDLSDTTRLENIRVGLISSLSCLEELRMQGSGVCKMDSPMVANYLMEMRSLKRLAILSISTVRYDDLLDTIMCLQGQNLQVYSINLYGSTGDYSEDV